MCFFSTMDFKAINKVSLKSKYPENIKLAALAKDKFTDVLNIRQIELRDSGTKLIADLPERKTVFLPTKISDYLLENPSELKFLTKLGARKSVSIRSLGGAGLRWLIKGEKKCKYHFCSTNNIIKSKKKWFFYINFCCFFIFSKTESSKTQPDFTTPLC